MSARRYAGRYAEIEDTMFRAALAHPDPVRRVHKSDRAAYNGAVARAVAELERFAAEMPALVEAARAPLARGSTKRLRRGIDAIAALARGGTTSVLWDAASTIDEMRRRGRKTKS